VADGRFTEATPEVLAHVDQTSQWLSGPDVAARLHEVGIDVTPADIASLQGRLTKAHLIALTVYSREGYTLLNTLIRERLDPAYPRGTEFETRLTRLTTGYLTSLAGGNHPPVPGVVHDIVHQPDGSGVPGRDLASRWVDAERERQAADLAGDSARIRAAEQDRDAAWQAIDSRLAAAVPALRTEMRWHADMVHDALMALPKVGSDRPVIAVRGDGTSGRDKQILYGTPTHPTGHAHQVVSLSHDVLRALDFMRWDGDPHKAVVLYVLTGVNARYIAPFSIYPWERESVLPPGALTERVDPSTLPPDVQAVVNDAVAQVRGGLYPGENPEIIVMREVPGVAPP
jgi:hypothetical protein